MSFKRYRIIFILIFMVFGMVFGDQTPTHHMINDMENVQSDNKEGRALFPRADYTNEWQPVGKGDPLKDPTYDYLPPVLDRVRYWAEGTGNKNEVLVLGVPSKKIIKPNEKYNYGPIKRTYFSPPYQSHYSSPHQHYQQQQQQQQHLPQRLMPPPKHVTDSYPMSTHHYQYNQYQQHGWKTPNNVYTEHRPENSINHVRISRPIATQSPPTASTTTRHPSSRPFLPTIPPADRSKETLPTSPTKPMSTQTTVNNVPKTTVNGHIMPSKIENSHKDTTKPLLQSILQTETASPFTKKPSSVYQIEYTSNIYNPEAINSMATSSSNMATFVPTKPTLRPTPMKTTFKTSLEPSTSTAASTTEQEEQKQQHYIVPDMHPGWPVYNLVIEGHSKVKTYGLKSEDEIGKAMIRPVQAKENPIVERVTNSDEGPEFNVKHLKANKKDSGKFSRKTEDNKKSESAMDSLLSLLDSSFGNFLSEENSDKVRHESEKRMVKNEKENMERRKTRRSIPDDENSKQVFGVSFQEANERPLNSRVIS